MDSGLNIVGALGATAWVVAANAPAKIKIFAQMLQNRGYPVWVCDGTADNVEIQAAIDAAGKGKVVGIGLTFNIVGSITLGSNQELELQTGSKVVAQTVGMTMFILNGTRIRFLFDELDGNSKADYAIKSLGSQYMHVEGNKISGYVEAALYNDSANATGPTNDNYIEIALVLGGKYGLLATSPVGGQSFEGNELHLNLVVGQTVAPIQLGSTTTEKAFYNTIFGSLEGDSVSPILIDCYNSFNTFILDFAGGFTGTYGFRFRAGTQNNRVISATPCRLLDEGANLEQTFGINNQSFANLLSNGDFEIGDPPTGWSIEAGAAAERSATQVKVGSYSMKITAAGGWSGQQQSIANYGRYAGRKVALGCWCWAAIANDKVQDIEIVDNIGASQSITIPKDGTWHWITISRNIPAGITSLRVILRANFSGDADADDVVHFDGAMLVEGDSCPAFSPKPASLEYTDAAIDTDIATHAALPDVHHARQHAIDAGADHTGRAALSQMPDGAATLVLTAQGAGSDPVYAAATITTTAPKATDTLRNSNDTEKSTTATAYTKRKEVKLNATLAACRIKFDVRFATDNGGSGEGKIYKNGVAIGTERAGGAGNFTTYSEDFTGLVANDLIQIYAKAGGGTTAVRNMRFYYSKYITAVGGDTLDAALLTTTDPTISITNQDPA